MIACVTVQGNTPKEDICFNMTEPCFTHTRSVAGIAVENDKLILSCSNAWQSTEMKGRAIYSYHAANKIHMIQ